MRISAVIEDNTCVVDGVVRSVNLAGIVAGLAQAIDPKNPPEIHALQWYGDENAGAARGARSKAPGAWGEVELKGGRGVYRITDAALLAPLIEAFAAAAPPPATLEDLRRNKRAEIRAEAVRRAKAINPEVDNPVLLRLIRIIWPAIRNTATPELARIRALADFAEDTAPQELARLTEKQLDALDRASEAPFGADRAAWPE